MPKSDPVSIEISEGDDWEFPTVNGGRIHVFHESIQPPGVGEPLILFTFASPTDIFTQKDKAELHLGGGGAKEWTISAPSKDAMPKCMMV